MQSTFYLNLIQQQQFTVGQHRSKYFANEFLTFVNMHYLTALKAGVEPSIVARDFIQELVLASNCSGQIELSIELISDFINDTLLAIGIPGQITPQQIDDGPNSYQWPTEVLQIYSFPYNHLEFTCVEKFLLAICEESRKQHEQFINELEANARGESDFESPITLLMELLGGWRSAYKQLQKKNCWGTAQKFEEPLARINVCLLEGMHNLRMKYRTEFSLLDTICDTLYASALHGLCYKQSNGPIIDRLLKLITADLEMFKEKIVKFFYDVLTLEYTPGISKLYNGLRVMLEESEDSRLNILTDVLIKQEFLEIYYTTLVTHQGIDVVKRQLETLGFLKVLQGKLITLDCFTRDFMEAILHLLFQNKKTISPVACSLYVTMMKRKMPDEEILRHILKFGLNYMISSAQLVDYVGQFYKHFEYFQNVNHFFKIITDSDNGDDLRLMSSQVVVLIIEIIAKNKESFLAETEPILLVIPELFEKIEHQQCFGILLGMLKYVPIEKLQRQTLDHITLYAANIFKTIGAQYEYPLLLNIFSIFHKCLIVTNDWHHLEMVSDELMLKYRDMMRNMQMKRDKVRKKLPFDFYTNLLEIFKRINIIIKTPYETFDNLYDMIENLQEFIIDNNAKEFQEKDIDLYALEICISSLIKQEKRESTTSRVHTTCFVKALNLSKYLINCLKNIEEPTKLPAFRLKVYFCSLLNLYCNFSITLSSNVYCYLAEILTVLQGQSKSDQNHVATDIHPFNVLEYYRLMFEHFTELHKYQHIQIKSHIVWKLCVRYGEPHNQFNEEIKQLLITLAKYRMNLYTHVSAVIIYNLYKIQPPIKANTIVLHLKKQKALIDTEMQDKTPNNIKLSIVLLLIEMIGKSLNVLKLNNQQNRLEALRHLNVFLEDVDLRELQANQLISEQLDIIRKHLLTTEELQTLQNCQTFIGNF
ncbi:sisters unbound [Musca autumnalis]|uniref:sisters unbound n=1 Tax=Musca autumnalis TaxID=221902 RepID=UPI003CF08A73